MAGKWSKTDGDVDPVSLEALHSHCYQPKQQPSLAEQLGKGGTAQLIARYQRGATQQELADCYRVSVSSVKRLIHAHGAQLWRRRPNQAR